MSNTADPVYLIVGATGKQGGQALSTLHSERPSTATSSIRFITRNPDSIASKKLAEKGCTPIKADLLDHASLVTALQGVDRAFLVTDALVGEEKEELQGVTFINAAKEAGVKVLVFTSVSAADLATNVPHFQSKARIEKHLKASGLDYTILRPVAFMDNFPLAPSIARFMAIGLFFSFTNWKPVGFIATEDIGVFAAKALLSPTDKHFHNTTIDLSAGEYNMRDVEDAIEAAQGSRPWVARYAPRFIRRLLPYDFRQMMIYFEEQGFPETDVDELKKIHPGLMSWNDWARKGSPTRA